MWAEAVEREAMGESIELPKELWKDAEREQQAHMEKDHGLKNCPTHWAISKASFSPLMRG